MSQKDVGKIVTAILATLLGVFVIIAIFSSVYTLKDSQQAVVTTLGVPKTISSSGLHFKLPFIQKVKKVDTTIKGFPIGYYDKTNVSIEKESLMITKDFNFVNVDFYVEYKVVDPVKALYNTEEPVVVLKNLVQSYIRDTIGLYNVDDVITSGKAEIQAEIKDKLINRLEADDIGIQLVNITIQDAEPPTLGVMDAFKAVETAKQGKETALNNANRYKNERLPAAEAEVDLIVKEAEATKQGRINEARGQTDRFNSMYEEYSKYPLITKQRMFYEAMREVMPGLKVIIDNTDTGVSKMLPLEQFSNVNNASNTGNVVGAINN